MEGTASRLPRRQPGRMKRRGHTREGAYDAVIVAAWGRELGERELRALDRRVRQDECLTLLHIGDGVVERRQAGRDGADADAGALVLEFLDQHVDFFFFKQKTAYEIGQ